MAAGGGMSWAEWLTVIFAALAVPQIGGPVFAALSFVLALLLRLGAAVQTRARDRYHYVQETFGGYVTRTAVISAILGAGVSGLLLWLRT